MSLQELTREQHLLVCLFEECAEVQQRIAKALRFGIHETQIGQPLNNTQRIEYELRDLLTIIEMLQDAGLLTKDLCPLAAKRTKVENYISYARSIQMLRQEAQ